MRVEHSTVIDYYYYCFMYLLFFLHLFIGSQAKNSSHLYEWHIRSWLDVWQQGRIDVEGNLTVARALAGSLYSIFISLPHKEDPLQPFIGLSPCGLSWGDEEVHHFSVIFPYLFVSCQNAFFCQHHLFSSSFFIKAIFMKTSSNIGKRN